MLQLRRVKEVKTVCLAILAGLAGPFVMAETIFVAPDSEILSPPRVLRILNWSMYIDFDDDLPDDLPATQRSPTLREFAEKFNCEVVYDEFDEFDSMLEKFTSLSGFYDIMVLSCGYADSLISLDMLLPISVEQIPHLASIDESSRYSPPDPQGRFLVPYLTDYVGLAFRRDLLQTEQLAWAQYFAPPDNWKGRVGVFASAPVMFALSVISSGKDYPHATEADLEQAKDKIAHLLYDFSPLLSDDPLVLGNALLAGEIVATPLYAPDAQALLAKSTDIAFLIPEDGSEYYRDYLVINKDSQQPELACEFINYLLTPEVAGRISAYLGAGATSKEARQIASSISSPLVPAAVDANGQPFKRLQITYAINPGIEFRWVELLSQFEQQADTSEAPSEGN